MGADSEAVPAVRLRGVRKQFGPVVAVDGVDLSVHDREFLTLLGPSGSGKTTVLRHDRRVRAAQRRHDRAGRAST